MNTTITEDIIENTEQITPTTTTPGAPPQSVIESVPSRHGHVTVRRSSTPQPQQHAIRPRIRLCKPQHNNVTTTPVTETPRNTHHTRIIPIQGNVTVETPTRRKLTFNIASARKRFRSSSSTIKIHGNVQRTQPATPCKSPSSSSCTGHLQSLLLSHCKSATDATSAFRNLVSSTTSGTPLNTSMFSSSSLILNVLYNLPNGIYITTTNFNSNSNSSSSSRVAVFVSRSIIDMDQSDCLNDECTRVLYIPQPWYAVKVNNKIDKLASDLNVHYVITPFRVLVIDSNRLPTLPTSLATNSKLLKLLKQTDQHQQIERSTVCHRFSDISQHDIKMSICGRVVFKMNHSNMALLQDIGRDLAVLVVSHENHTFQIGIHTFHAVTILPDTIPADVVHRLIIGNNEREYEQFSSDIKSMLNSNVKLVVFSI